MKISIIGLGRFGEWLGRELLKDGHLISGSTRTELKKKELEHSGFNVSLLSPPHSPLKLLEADIIVVNIPPFERQLHWYKSWPWDKKAWIIFISSTSVVPHPDSEGGVILKEEEEWFKHLSEDTTILRFGGLLMKKSHPGKYLSGKTSLPGRLWPVNLIHLEDTVMATKVVIEKKLKKMTANVVSDEHPTREEFYTHYCKKQGLPLPEFDQNDFSPGKTVSSDELKKFYTPQKSIWDHG
jgi:nucleoside-diphosphate-sugar epimerase